MKDYSSISHQNNSDKNFIELSKKRILLWDIDGTLLRSKVHGDYKKYFAATMNTVFGSKGNLDEIPPSGMTDTQIMYEALKAEGFKPAQILECKTEVLTVFKQKMTEVLSSGGEPFELLEGADEILAATEKDSLFINSLLTGNLSVAAELKLEKVGLWHYFAHSPNAFGEISHERKDLAVEAGKLFNAAYDFEFNPQQFIVIGDTPNDVLCARHLGAKCVVVLTGRSQTRKKLSEYKPDLIIENLSDTQEILQILTSL